MNRQTLALALSAVVGSFALAAPAFAQDEESELAPSEPLTAATGSAAAGMVARPLYFSLGFGPTITFDGGDVQMKVQEEGGYHFWTFGDHPGLFGGLTIAESFVDYVVFQIGVRAGFDFLVAPIGNSMALVATPSLALGGGIFFSHFTNPITGERQSNTDGAFNLQIAGDVKLVMLEGLLAIWLRPLGFDFFIRDNSTVRYDLLFGVQINL